MTWRNLCIDIVLSLFQVVNHYRRGPKSTTQKKWKYGLKSAISSLSSTQRKAKQDWTRPVGTRLGTILASATATLFEWFYSRNVRIMLENIIQPSWTISFRGGRTPSFSQDWTKRGDWYDCRAMAEIGFRVDLLKNSPSCRVIAHLIGYRWRILSLNPSLILFSLNVLYESLPEEG